MAKKKAKAKKIRYWVRVMVFKQYSRSIYASTREGAWLQAKQRAMDNPRIRSKDFLEVEIREF